MGGWSLGKGERREEKGAFNRSKGNSMFFPFLFG